MLVAYHDLIGDVIGNERDREQILGIIRTIEDFDMLVAISKADVSSLVREGGRNVIFLGNSAQWLANINDQVPLLREWVAGKLEVDDD